MNEQHKDAQRTTPTRTGQLTSQQPTGPLNQSTQSNQLANQQFNPPSQRTRLSVNSPSPTGTPTGTPSDGHPDGRTRTNNRPRQNKQAAVSHCLF
eukprot:m.90310 g.90310  ORF g.90310 m.90310 type:complete len:95 (-) comp15005_c0_seq2:980-1264(-)